MNPSNLFRCCLIALMLSGLVFPAQAQKTSGTVSEKTIYHWRQEAFAPLPAEAAKEYQKLPQASYTPAVTLREWSAAPILQEFAEKYPGKKLTVRYVFTVDEAGYIQAVKLVETNDRTVAASLRTLLVKTKLSGPSFLKNTAVASYVPCLMTISDKQITIQ